MAISCSGSEDSGAAMAAPRSPADGPEAVAELWRELGSLKDQFEALIRGLRGFDETLHAKVCSERYQALKKRNGAQLQGPAAPPAPKAAALLEALRRPAFEALAGPGALACVQQASRTCRLRLERRPERLLVFGGENGVFSGSILRTNESLELPLGDGRHCKGGGLSAANGSTWRPLPPMRFGRTGSCAVVLRRQVYVCGGGGVVGKIVDRFTPDTNKWDFKVNAMQESRQYAAAAALDGRIYIGGGHDSANAREEVLSSVECFDPDDGERGRWELEPYSMRERRRHFGMAPLGDRMMVCGGDCMPMSQIIAKQKPLDTAECFFLGRNGWAAEMPPMTVKRTAHGVASLRGHVYAAGGENAFVGLQSVERYEALAGCWVAVSAMPMGAFCIGLVAGAGYLYCFGGNERTLPPGTKGPALSRVQRYDPEENSWDFLASMGQSRNCVACVAVPI